jgi:GTPase
MKFVDYAKILVKSGYGGPGHVSFRREKFVPKGGPDGGNGGKGGDIVFITDPQMSTLLDFKYNRHYKAKRGNPGEKSRKTGKNAPDVEIKVPCGTLIKNVETDEIIADLTEPYKRYVLLEGGIGGRGNSEFATPTNQAPRFAQPGRPGSEMEILLELKLIADVGLVGFPNAGKSTLISSISAAKPKIADYPFTTLVPNLGIVKVGDYKSFTVADIPGLIEGASEGKGLGINFLRHVERTSVLVYMIECISETPVEDFLTLQNELVKYNPDMGFKDKIILITKGDVITDEEKQELTKLKFPKYKNKPMVISAVSGENLDKLKWMLWERINEMKERDL